MVEKIIILFFLVNAIHYSMQDGEIFGALGSWFNDHTPEIIHKPLYECNICQSPWYGAVLYFVIPWQHIWWECLIVIIGAMGMNVVFNGLKPDK